MHTTIAKDVIKKLRETFLQSNGFEQIFSSAAYHSASNGAAESAVKICRNILKKAILDRQDIDTALCRAPPLHTYIGAYHGA